MEIGGLKEKIIKIFDRYIKDEYILILFGSFAKNNNTRSSDVDIGVYKKNGVDNGIFLKIKDELEEITLRDIDVVDLYKVKDFKFLDKVIREGVIWKGKNSKELLKDLKKHLESLKKL